MDKILLSKAKDIISLCDKYSKPKFSTFMTQEEMCYIRDNMPIGNGMFYGGYNDAERVIFGAFPDWEEPDINEFPISCIKISKKYSRTLTHRDYLGSILGLGIERTKTGDIKTDENDAYVFVCEDIAEFIVRGLNKIGSCGVKCEIPEREEIFIPQQEYIFKDEVCASMRFDAIIAAAYNLSRGAAVKLIQGKCAMLNHRECVDLSKEVKPGDLVSLRRYGRFIVHSVGKTTSKGRLHIVLKFYK
ncbi:MAG: hypothetical protein J1F64_05460 [Oscillospiraceae bacterium]|nr:hypothetical protein [Oscillospiraceae bacterium]